MANIGVSNIGLIHAFLVAWLSLLLIHGGPAEDFHEWCRRTTQEGTCLSAILSDHRDYLKTSPNGFCTILIQKAREVVTSAIQKVNDLLVFSKLSALAIRLLQNCSAAYYSAIGLITGLNFTVLNNETYPELNIIYGRIYNGVSQCEDAFKPSNSSSPMEAEDRNITNLSETISEILNLVDCNQTSACLQG